MKKYFTADREAGNFIDSFDTYQEAAEAIRAYEEEDRADGTYTEDFYEIKERSMDYKWFIIDDCGDIFETPTKDGCGLFSMRFLVHILCTFFYEKISRKKAEKIAQNNILQKYILKIRKCGKMRIFENSSDILLQSRKMQKKYTTIYLYF